MGLGGPIPLEGTRERYMGIIGKLVGGTIGFALAGPLGAVFGAVFGHAFDSENTALQGSQRPEPSMLEESQLAFFGGTSSGRC